MASDDTEDTKRLGTRGMADVGAVRLAAGVALLRLARCHDTRIPPAIYCLLALTMQARLAYVSPQTRRTALILFTCPQVGLQWCACHAWMWFK